MRLSAGTPFFKTRASQLATTLASGTRPAECDPPARDHLPHTSGRSLKVRRLPWEQEQAGALPVVPTTFLPYQRMHGVCSLPVKQRELGATPSAGATFLISNGACDVTAAYLPVKEAVRGRNPSGTPLSASYLPSSSMSRNPDSQSGKPCASHGEGATFNPWPLE